MIRLAILVAVAALFLAACGAQAPDPRSEPVPAQVEADQLHKDRAASLVEAAEQGARAKGLDHQADGTPDPARAAALRLDAERARLAGAVAQARADAQAKLEKEAQTRAVAERAEIDRRAQAAERAATAKAEETARAADRRRAGYGIALAVVAAIVLRFVLGLPGTLSIGIPGAAIAGCLTLAGWSTVPWVATAIGWAIGAVVLVALGLLAAWLAREWQQHAADAFAKGKSAADALSLSRQPAWLRWIVDHLLAWTKPAAPAADDHA